ASKKRIKSLEEEASIAKILGEEVRNSVKEQLLELETMRIDLADALAENQSLLEAVQQSKTLESQKEQLVAAAESLEKEKDTLARENQSLVELNATLLSQKAAVVEERALLLG
ncbi:unnamed protein product, partial [Amoebophrya sp. A25]